MSKNKVTCRDFTQRDGWVFVTPKTVPDTVTVQTRASHYFSDWTGIVKDIVNETPLTSPEPKPIEAREHQPVQRQTPSEMLSALRARQMRRTKIGMQKVKRSRRKAKVEPKPIGSGNGGTQC